MIDVRTVIPEDWQELRRIRLEALQSAPEAFCSTYEEASCIEDDVWISRAKQDGEGDALGVLAVQGDRAVGMAVGLLRQGGTGDHVEVVSVFVSDDVRGSGTADAILQQIETWASDKGASSAFLLVEENNNRARKFYEKRDFALTNERVSSPMGADLWQAKYVKTLQPS